MSQLVQYGAQYPASTSIRPVKTKLGFSYRDRFFMTKRRVPKFSRTFQLPIIVFERKLIILSIEEKAVLSR